MSFHLQDRIEALRSSFWFVPSLMLFGACGLAIALLHLDYAVDPGMHSTLAWAYSGGPEGARSLLSTIAGSMITAASVTFSLATVALSLASQQYGSRVLRNFMRDTVTQIMLGAFIATFLYSVLVVRDIRGSDISGGFVPAISVTMAIVLSLVSLVMLVYFVHHVALSIQASHILTVIADDIADAIPRLYPSQSGEPLDDRSELERLAPLGSLTISLPDSGYLKAVDLKSLLKTTAEADAVIELLIKPGDHSVQGEPVARLYGLSHLDEASMATITDSFDLGGDRTPEQDIRFQFQQLTDVIIRALSPGINDPFTAINGIDELATGLVLLARRSPVAERRQDEEGHLRLLIRSADLDEVLEETVAHIAVYAATDHYVMNGLRRVLRLLRAAVHPETDLTNLDRLSAELDRRQKDDA